MSISLWYSFFSSFLFLYFILPSNISGIFCFSSVLSLKTFIVLMSLHFRIVFFFSCYPTISFCWPFFLMVQTYCWLALLRRYFSQSHVTPVVLFLLYRCSFFNPLISHVPSNNFSFLLHPYYSIWSLLLFSFTFLEPKMSPPAIVLGNKITSIPLILLPAISMSCAIFAIFFIAASFYLPSLSTLTFPNTSNKMISLLTHDSLN